MVLAHQDAWRKHPFISNCAKKPFTGLGTASFIFAVYLAVDTVTGRSDHAHAHAGTDAAHPELEYKPRGKYTFTRPEIGERPTLG